MFYGMFMSYLYPVPVNLYSLCPLHLFRKLWFLHCYLNP